MKFCLIAFTVMLLATHQCAFGKKSKVKAKLPTARGIPSILNKLPGINTLADAVVKFYSITNTVQPIFEEVKDLIVNGLKDPDISDNIKETYAQLYGAKGTKVGNLIQSVSDKLEKGMNVAEKLVAKVNQTLDDLSRACQNFVNKGLNVIGKNSKCSRAISEAGQKFTSALIENAKSCVKNIIKTINRRIKKINALQQEINSSIQTGKLRVQIFRDILQEAASMKNDVSSSLKNLADCEMKGLSNSLSTFTSSYASASLSCIPSIGSIFGK